MRTSASCLIALCLLLAGSSSAGAAAPEPFGHPCTAQDGIRFCPAATLEQRVPSWDGTPLDVDVSLPPTGDGPFPTIVMLHGLGGSKVMFESTTPEGASPDVWHYNNAYYAQQGYAVVNYSQRGWGASCGTAASRVGTPACDDGWVHLADQRYDTRDLQHLVGLLVDQRVTDPDAVGVTGISLGGGGSANAAFMRDEIRRPDGTFAPWRSPAGTNLHIAAAWPRWQWSDLADSLVPNGRFRDGVPATIGLGATPAGLMKQSFVTGLYATSLTSGYVAPEGVDPSADLIGWYGLLNGGEPYGRGVADVEKDLQEYHSAVGLYGRRPAPLLLQDGFTDDLFPAPQALRTYDQLTRRTPRSAVALQLGDLGHGRAQNKVRVNHAFNTAGAAFLAAHLKGQGTPPRTGSVTVLPQTCPATAPDGDPITAASWAAIHPGTFTVVQAPPPRRRHRPFTGRAQTAATRTQPAQELSHDGGDPAIATALNFPQNRGQTCQAFPSAKAPGTAAYARGVARAFTMVGSPSVTARVTVGTRPNAYPQLIARLWDVAPGGTQRLIARGAYRVSSRDARITFQLWGNAYRFAAGHRVRVELLGQDASGENRITPVPDSPASLLAEAGQVGALLGNFMRPSNGTFTARLSDVTITLPTHERRPQG